MKIDDLFMPMKTNSSGIEIEYDKTQEKYF